MTVFIFSFLYLGIGLGSLNLPDVPHIHLYLGLGSVNLPEVPHIHWLYLTGIYIYGKSIKIFRAV